MGEKGKFFHSLLCQFINLEGTMNRTSLFFKHPSSNWLRQESLMVIKTSHWKFDEDNDTDIVLEEPL